MFFLIKLWESVLSKPFKFTLKQRVCRYGNSWWWGGQFWFFTISGTHVFDFWLTIVRIFRRPCRSHSHEILWRGERLGEILLYTQKYKLCFDLELVGGSGSWEKLASQGSCQGSEGKLASQGKAHVSTISTEEFGQDSGQDDFFAIDFSMHFWLQEAKLIAEAMKHLDDLEKMNHEEPRTEERFFCWPFVTQLLPNYCQDSFAYWCQASDSTYATLGTTSQVHSKSSSEESGGQVPIAASSTTGSKATSFFQHQCSFFGARSQSFGQWVVWRGQVCSLCSLLLP